MSSPLLPQDDDAYQDWNDYLEQRDLDRLKKPRVGEPPDTNQYNSNIFDLDPSVVDLDPNVFNFDPSVIDLDPNVFNFDPTWLGPDIFGPNRPNQDNSVPAAPADPDNMPDYENVEEAGTGPSFNSSSKIVISSNYTIENSANYARTGNSANFYAPNETKNSLDYYIMLNRQKIMGLLSERNDEVIDFQADAEKDRASVFYSFEGQEKYCLSYAIKPVLLKTGKKRTPIRIEISQMEKTAIANLYRRAADSGLCKQQIADAETTTEKYGTPKAKGKESEFRVYENDTGRSVTVLYFPGSTTIADVKKDFWGTQANHTEELRKLYNKCVGAGFVHGKLSIRSVKYKEKDDLSFSHLTELSRFESNKKLRELAVIYEWMQDTGRLNSTKNAKKEKPDPVHWIAKDWQSDDPNAFFFNLRDYYKRIYEKYKSGYFTESELVQATGQPRLPEPTANNFSLFRIPVGGVIVQEPTVIEKTNKRKNVGMRFGAKEGEEDEDPYLQADGQGRQVLRSALAKFDIDRSTKKCGAFGCTYRIRGTEPPQLIKIGRISTREINISLFAGEVGIGPKVFELVPVELSLRGSDDVTASTAIVMEAYDNTLEQFAFQTWAQVNALFQLYRSCVRFGLVHGDMKANNIVYKFDDENRLTLRLIDFGASIRLFTHKPYATPLDAPAAERLYVTYDWIANIGMRQSGAWEKARYNALLRGLYERALAVSKKSNGTKSLREFGVKLMLIYKALHAQLGGELVINSKRIPIPEPLFIEN